MPNYYYYKNEDGEKVGACTDLNIAKACAGNNGWTIHNSDGSQIYPEDTTREDTREG